MTASRVQDPVVTNARLLRRRFSAIRDVSMRLTKSLSAEDHMLQSMPDASPAKWHLAHTTWFFETFILQPNFPGYKPFDSRYTYLFNSYYKQLGSHPYRGARGLMSRPSLDEVHAYRSHVDGAMVLAFESFSEEVLPLIEIGLNHEQQHQELILTDIKNALWSSPLPPEVAATKHSSPAAASSWNWIDIEGGIYSIGHEGEGFAFDNESPRHEVLLQPFRIASRLVTNAEYLEFMRDGGYRRPEFWLSEGWDAICNQRWNSPLYWEERDGAWWHFTRESVKEVNLAEPVCHVSYYEADAFAHWSGARLLTEQEWEVAAAQASTKGTFLDDGTLHPQPARGQGLQQMLGDVWEWTSSSYSPYPGFRPAPGAVGEYNGKFMCNQYVLRGGSCATPSDHIRVTYRNFFPPPARWQFSGIRLANDRS